MQAKFLIDFQLRHALVPKGYIAEFPSSDVKSTAMILGHHVQFSQVMGVVDILRDMNLVADESIIAKAKLTMKHKTRGSKNRTNT